MEGCVLFVSTGLVLALFSEVFSLEQEVWSCEHNVLSFFQIPLQISETVGAQTVLLSFVRKLF